MLAKLRVAVLVLCAACLSSCTPQASTPEISELRNDAVILAFGDSLTYGSGVSSEDSYPQALARLIERKVINLGVPGETSQQGLARLPSALSEFTPDLMILIHGGNDMLQGSPKETLKKNLAQMIEVALKSGTELIMLSVPRPSVFLKPAELYAELASDYSIPIDKTVLTEVLKDRSLKSDQIHPNATGYKIMAERVQALLIEAGALDR